MRTLFPLLLVGCSPWSFNDPASYTWVEALWDPAVVAAADGLYVRLPHAGKLARIDPASGKFAEVNLGGAAPEQMTLAPDGSSLLVRVNWQVCLDDDPKIKAPYDCPDDALETVTATDLVRGGERVTSVDVPSVFNAWTFDKNTNIAAATVDLDNGGTLDVNGLLNLTEVVFVELGSGASHHVPIGFAAEHVLFTLDGSRALVLSRSAAAVIDLASWSKTVEFQLVIDDDQSVTPEEAVLTPDGRYAILRVGGSDLYTLDLENPHIDLIELDGNASDLLVDNTADLTLAVMSNEPVVTLIDHEIFETINLELDEPAEKIVGGDGMALLYNTSSRYKDVYLINTLEKDVEEFRAENPILEMYLAEDRSVAVATTEPESTSGSGATGLYDRYYGLSIFPLTVGADPIPLILESAPLGLELVAAGGVQYALLLLDGGDELLKVNLASGEHEFLSLPGRPTGISASPDGQFVITQDASLGLISLLDPTDNSFTHVNGFGQLGLLVEPGFAARASE